MSILGVLVSIIWVSQALRDLDLVTNKGQSLELLFTLTWLTMPTILMIILPVALFIACLSALNKFQADSEWVVMVASGASPWRLAQPFVVLGSLIAAFVALMSLEVSPSAQRELRHYLSAVRADLITNAVRPGQFLTLDEGVVFHLHARAPSGTLSGIFLQDKRDVNLTTSYFAEAGQIVKNANGSFLIMDNGMLYRNAPDGKESQVQFVRYAIDLSDITSDKAKLNYKPRERRTSELMAPTGTDEVSRFMVGRFRAELHDRFIAPLYAFVMPLLALAFMGKARTTRQNRLQILLLAVGIALSLRIFGFAASGMAARSMTGVFLGYGVPIVVLLVSIFALLGWKRMHILPKRPQRTEVQASPKR